MPNKFQIELAARNRVINGRVWHWQTTQRQRCPVELRSRADGGFTRNEILTTLDQRAFATLDAAGVWRRLAAERLALGQIDKARVCKQAAHEHIRSARSARIAAATRARIFQQEAA